MAIRVLSIFILLAFPALCSASYCVDLLSSNRREVLNTGSAKVFAPVDYNTMMELLPYKDDPVLGINYQKAYNPFIFPHVGITVPSNLSISYLFGAAARDYRIKTAGLSPEAVKAIEIGHATKLDIESPVRVKTVRVPLTARSKTWPIISLNIEGAIHHLDLFGENKRNIFFYLRTQDFVNLTFKHWRDGFSSIPNFYENKRGNSGAFRAQVVGLSPDLNLRYSLFSVTRGVWEISGDFLILRIEDDIQQFPVEEVHLFDYSLRNL